MIAARPPSAASPTPASRCTAAGATTAAIRKAFDHVTNPDTTENTFRAKSLELGERKAALKKLLDYTASYTPAH